MAHAEANNKCFSEFPKIGKERITMIHDLERREEFAQREIKFHLTIHIGELKCNTTCIAAARWHFLFQLSSNVWTIVRLVVPFF